jgi:putative flippase GtrA
VYGLVSRHADKIAELWRYYKIGVINTIFGLGIYSILVFIGINLFVAQILSHVAGVTFNYFTFTRHVFKGVKPNLLKYIASYGLNYLIGLTFLAAIHHFIASPYVSGFLAALGTSVVNYVVLKIFVFGSRATPTDIQP